MKNPFPGMNPFIEANDCWPDFHLTFIATCREQLLTRLPANYYARIDERVQLVDQGDLTVVAFRPDVSLLRVPASSEESSGVATLLDLQPVTCHNVEPETESVGFIEIVTASSGQLVTVIEVLSPTNKKEPGRGAYRAKMEHLRKSGVHVVEIDLLLGGERLHMQEPLPPGDFYTLITRREKYPLCDVYAWPMRRVLPKLPIPLNQPDLDIILDLAEVFSTTFDRGGYGRNLRYDIPLPQTLATADREWAGALVKPLAR